MYQEDHSAGMKVTYPATLRGLIAWLETQDPSREYNYFSSRECLVAEFQRTQGRDYFSAIVPLEGPLSEAQKMEAAACGGLNGDCMTWTFGAALLRARKLLAEGS